MLLTALDWRKSGVSGRSLEIGVDVEQVEAPSPGSAGQEACATWPESHPTMLPIHFVAKINGDGPGEAMVRGFLKPVAVSHCAISSKLNVLP